MRATGWVALFALRSNLSCEYCASSMSTGVRGLLRPMNHRSLRGVATLASLLRRIKPPPIFISPNFRCPFKGERMSFIALRMKPPNAPGPPRISSIAIATPHVGLSYFAYADHPRQALLSVALSPGQLVPAGLGPAFTTSRPRLYVAPTERPSKKLPLYEIELSVRVFGM